MREIDSKRLRERERERESLLGKILNTWEECEDAHRVHQVHVHVLSRVSVLHRATVPAYYRRPRERLSQAPEVNSDSRRGSLAAPDGWVRATS